MTLLPVVSVFIFNTGQPIHNIPVLLSQRADTGIIIHHRQDGSISEWPSSKFETDIGTDISYAIDNDTANLYFALNIPNQGIQMKLMRTGMNLYIDLKGKRKEGRGISFPVKDESITADKTLLTGVEDDNGMAQSQKQSSIKAVRSSLAIRLTYMSVFGFEGVENHDQGLQMPGSINISFAWDTANIMHIEYAVPLKMLGSATSLKNNEISVGWKINGIYPAEKTAGKRPHNRAAAGYGQTQTGFDPNAKRLNRETIIREQNIWTKYTFQNS
jgi:hypothetical protein